MDRLSRAGHPHPLGERAACGRNWCGETHIQKAVYLLKPSWASPRTSGLFFYKHGPYSFDLANELTGLRGDQLLALEVEAPYGPHLCADPASERLEVERKQMIARFADHLRYVAPVMGDRTIAQLERLGTAFTSPSKRPLRTTARSHRGPSASTA